MPEKHIWHQLLQVDRPTTAQFAGMGVKHLPFIDRLTYAGWTDPLVQAPEAWLDNMASTLVAPYGWAGVDHEGWPHSTQAERLATSALFAVFHNNLRTWRPDVRFVHYGYAPKRDLFRAKTLPGHPDYIAWQAENDDMAEMAAVVDGFAPSIYYFYNEEQHGVGINAGVEDYYRENIREAKRLRDTYGDPTRPIYPYIWWKAHSAETEDLDPAAWNPMVDISLSEADGCILWGGFQNAWSDSNAWWKYFRGALPRRHRAGVAGRVSQAAG
jgi:hypothetical protein